MELFHNILKLSAGVGLFLFAMYFIEEALKNLSGRKFKLFLKGITKNRLGAASGGALVTGLLQSSSMVSVMVLAFVGAGVFTLKSALAIILGANFGTTLDSWVVATLGFKTNIEVIAYPALCLGGILLLFFGNKKNIKYFSFFLFGFGLLFIGLSFMRTAMELQVTRFNFSAYAHLPSLTFLFIGFCITLLVQSSSVTMALTLTALHVGAINLPSAAVLVLGSETGTTIKLLLITTGGHAAKKRVVLGNIIFNIFLTICAFIFLHPLLVLITDVMHIESPLIQLVTFSSIVNLISILIFLPFLDSFVKFLERYFKGFEDSATAFISNADLSEPYSALDMFELETGYFIYNSLLFNMNLFGINTDSLNANPAYIASNQRKNINSKSFAEKYDLLKQLQGELQLLYLKLRVKLEGADSNQLERYIASVRSSMSASKHINDILSDINNLKRSSKSIKFDLFNENQETTQQLYYKLATFLETGKTNNFNQLKEILIALQTNYSLSLSNFYIAAQNSNIDVNDMTTVINFNHALFTSNKALIMAIKDLTLNEKESVEFNSIPAYIT